MPQQPQRPARHAKRILIGALEHTRTLNLQSCFTCNAVCNSPTERLQKDATTTTTTTAVTTAQPILHNNLKLVMQVGNDASESEQGIQCNRIAHVVTAPTRNARLTHPHHHRHPQCCHHNDQQYYQHPAHQES